MSIVVEQLCVIIKLFPRLFFKLAANLIHQVPQFVRDVRLPRDGLLATVELKAVAVLKLVLLLRELAESQLHQVLRSASDLVKKMTCKRHPECFEPSFSRRCQHLPNLIGVPVRVATFLVLLSTDGERVWFQLFKLEHTMQQPLENSPPMHLC